MNYTSSAIEEVSNEVTAMDAAELISERYRYCEFALNVNMFNYHQQQKQRDTNTNRKRDQKHPNSTLYTTKEIEGVNLIHKNNKIRVSTLLQERVMN